MCMYTSRVERTPGAGRQANFSSGVASASAINCRDTLRHSPSYPCQIPSGGACASKGRALNKRSRKSVFLMVYLPSGPHLYGRSEEHTSELQSHLNLVCRLLLEKKNRDIAI